MTLFRAAAVVVGLAVLPFVLMLAVAELLLNGGWWLNSRGAR